MGCSFSIIVPTFNRCATLRRTLESLIRVDNYHQDFEVLIIDNGSSDGTSAMLEKFCSCVSRRQWRVLTEPIPGLLSARHRGALESTGDICIFIDDDVRLDPEWLNAFRDAFEDASVVLVGGPSWPLFEVEPPPWLRVFQSVGEAGTMCVSLSLFDGGTKIKEIDPIYIFGLNFAIRRETLFAQGGFHPDCLPRPLQRYQGDGETGLSMKIKQSGLKALYHPQASLRHEIAATRLTETYFKHWAFYHGVCDSYTQIRADGAIRSERPEPRHPLIRAKQMISRWLFPKRGGDYISATTKAYRRGFQFHQHEVKKDATLLNWVLQPDYWDYRLPAGWQRYQSVTKSSNISTIW